ncbi:MAG: hypothetical protein OXE42_04840 [Gammaproteobacteria bacterium]|nr:hypothetical protein [Gammaproteobacteria bacterium]
MTSRTTSHTRLGRVSGSELRRITRSGLRSFNSASSASHNEAMTVLSVFGSPWHDSRIGALSAGTPHDTSAATRNAARRVPLM